MKPFLETTVDIEVKGGENHNYSYEVRTTRIFGFVVFVTRKVLFL